MPPKWRASSPYRENRSTSSSRRTSGRGSSSPSVVGPGATAPERVSWRRPSRPSSPRSPAPAPRPPEAGRAGLDRLVDALEAEAAGARLAVYERLTVGDLVRRLRAEREALDWEI